VSAIFSDISAVKYLAAVGFGTLIIFFFANRRIEQLTVFPAGEEFETLRLLSTAAIAGKRAYRRAFIYYCMLLELIFVLLCVLQPVANTLLGSPVKDFKFDDVSWPFGAALIVVGLLPATPIFDQIELAFRKFAHHAAGIPEGFLTSISLLEKSELRDQILNDGIRYSDEEERYHKIRNILVSTGLPGNDTEYIAQCDLYLGVFYGWTIAPQTSTIWSAEARATFSNVRNVTSTRVIRLREDIDQLIKFSLDTEYLREMQREIKTQGMEGEIDPKIIRGAKSYDQEDKRRELLDRWDQRIKDISLAAKQLIAMFVLFAANDDKPNSDDPHFKEAVRLAWREQSNPLYNASATALLDGFLAALIVCSATSALFHFSENHVVVAAIEAGVRSGSLMSVNMAIQFSAALIVSISVYYSRDLQFRYGPDAPSCTIPVSERAALFNYSAATVIAISLINYVSYHWWNGTLTAGGALNSKDLPKDILFIAGWSIVPAVLALGCSLVAHRELCQKATGIYSSAVILLTSLAAFVILTLSQYEMTEAPFWTSMAAVTAFCFVAVMLFRYNARKVAA
jgi:hypothetical protein